MAGAGANLSLAVNGAGSTAARICDLRGPFTNYSISGGDGVSATADAFAGPSDDGPVVGTGLSVGLGLGGAFPRA